MTIKTLEVPSALPMQTRLAPVTTIDADTRTIEVTFTTGAAVRRVRWIGWDTRIPFDEVLTVTDAAVDLARLRAGAPALDSHSMWSTAAQVGVVERAWLEKGEGRAAIRFPSQGVDPASDRMYALVSEKIIRNVSVGYTINEVRVEAPQKSGEIEKRIVTRWTPFEISFVTVPADRGAQVRADELAVFPFHMTRAPVSGIVLAAARMRMRARAAGL
ncbi:HK97 family phage prohead protease [Xanthobacteraceae bacterium Astr-EGSB]|uniref:HK97 family phage prohead protease n=1 Tax=Astrobacterium formosum TaxID=3069710 RepID=UPI0027B47221|nr:HK97 family phage prohead protease [Xanthobacteraceae bacterium Astr-EGSB]